MAEEGKFNRENFLKDEKLWSILTLLSSLILFATTYATEYFNSWDSFLGLLIIYIVCFFSLLFSIIVRIIQFRKVLNRKKFLKSIIFELLLIIPPLLTITNPLLFSILMNLRQIVVLAKIFSTTEYGKRVILSLEKNPAKLLILTFLTLILIGTFLLTLPRATIDGRGASIEDAIFTSTSATCVTGLIVLNTNFDENANKKKQAFSKFGQIVILLLIQFGGIGIMIFSTSAILIIVGKLSLRGQKIVAEIIDESGSTSIKSILKYNLIMTFFIEALGSLILYFRFHPFLKDPLKALYYAIFHSISAFCNAGFSLFGNSLTYFRDDLILNITVCSLIILGGIGPMVISSLFNRTIFRYGIKSYIKRLDLHTKVVVIATIILIVSGFIAFYFFEYNHSLKNLDFSEKIFASLFQSITPRSAGFNTVDIACISRFSVIFLCVLMFIGGAPGGTAGGIKCSTVAIILLSLRAIITGREEIEAFGRTIKKESVLKAFTVTFISSCICILIYLLLLFSESSINSFALLFETLSAFGTVGLSMGATFKLTTIGKLLIITLMFIGRLGPLTIAMAMTEKKARAEIKYPEGKIYVC